MAEVVVSYVLGKITEAAYQEALLLYGVGDKLNWAKGELEWVSAFLKDASSKKNKDARVKQWVKDVKEVAYMIEDALDNYFLEMGGGRSKGVVRRVCRTPKVLVARHKVGKQIDNIKKRMCQIKENRENFGIMSLESSSGDLARRPVRPVVVPEIDKTEVIGFEEDVNNICEQLLDDYVSRRSVISIVGSGGRGKTTLASKIYKSIGVERHFDCRVWVTLSKEFNIIDVLQKILKKAHRENAREAEDEEDLITVLHESLRGKKYLVVLDDVWSSEGHNGSPWNRLEVAFPDDDNGSRVLITTRFIDVAKESDVVNKPYELRTLREEESQRLLLKKVFPNQFANECPDDLLPMINQFAQKCGGWPLALVVVGGILSTKPPDYYAWNKIMLQMDWQIEGSECLDIISTSYEDLPIHLKPCFLYIASFPEDFQINATTLLQLWIAEGFIRHDPKSRKTLEGKAEEYLEELVQRCMIQVSERSWSGRIKYCYVHDIIRELAIREAKEDDFLLVGSISDADSTSEINVSTRRIAFHEYKLPIRFGANLHSLLIFSGELPPNYSELRMLRILHLHSCPNDAKRLKHLTTLRYFQSYNVDDGFKLPVFLWDEEYLGRPNNPCQTLEFPVSFWNNKMLRYFKIIDSFIRVMGPPSSVNLENLVTLKGVVARDQWSRNLPHFPHIRKLGIFIQPYFAWEALANSMSKLKHLESLLVATHLGYEEPSYPWITSAFINYKKLRSLNMSVLWPKNPVIDSSIFPPQLVKLTLEHSQLRQNSLPELEKLPCLVVLRLLYDAYDGESLAFSAGGFRCLQQLKLEYLNYLVELKVEEGAMPRLNLLEICRCFELKILPEFQYLTHLRQLTLDTLPHFLGAHQHNVQHIPKIVILNCFNIVTDHVW